MPSGSVGIWPLATRMTAVFALLATLIVFSLLGAVTLMVQARSESDQRAVLQRLAQSAAASLDTAMGARYQDVVFLAALTELRQGSPAAQRQLLEQLQRQHPEFAWLGLVDAQGRVRASTGGVLEGQDVKDRPWFRAGLRGSALGDVHEVLLADPAAMQYAPSRFADTRFVDISVPVRDAQGRVQAVLGAHLSWSWLAAAERSVRELAPAGPPLEVLILDRRGQVLQVSGEQGARTRGRSETAGQGSRLPAVRGQDHVLTGLAMTRGQGDYSGLGWQVLIRQPRPGLWTTGVLPLSLLLGALSVLLLSLLVWGAFRRVTLALNALADSAGSLLRGEAETETRLGAVREFPEAQRLAVRVAELARRLQASEEEQGRLRARLERRVRQRSAQLRQTNEELETFSYSVSHDLRAPLRHVQGFVGMIRRSMAERLDEKSARYLTVIEGSAARMDTLIDALLDYSRTLRRPLQPAYVDLASLVEQARTELEPQVAERQVEWQIARLPVVVGDPFTLQRAIISLLSNALKFTSTREVAHIAVWADEHPGEWMIQVRDNGVGFDPRFAEKLFGIFQRLHRQEEFEGAGTGLAIVRRIVLRHGGQVWAEAQPERGATFAFTLPKRALAEAVQAVEDEQKLV